MQFRSRHFSYRLVNYLLIGGFSTLGEELGWRGYLQGALRPLGRLRGYLLLAFLWEIWHFTSHTKGTLHQVISRLEIIVPAIVVITFALPFSPSAPARYFLRPPSMSGSIWGSIREVISCGPAGLAAVPAWLWIAWTWPERSSEPIQHSTELFAPNRNGKAVP